MNEDILEETESTLLHKTSCSDCGSSDARAIYSDGGEHCYSCGAHVHSGSNNNSGGEPNVKAVLPEGLAEGAHQALPKRKLTLETCRFWDYQVGEWNGNAAQIANYKTAKGKPIGQKIRTAGKHFCTTGNFKQAALYGQWLWRDGGKALTIVEGEIDALSMSQAFQHKWPVVSLKGGAQGGAADVKAQLEWVSKFDSIVLMLDNDAVGREATEAIAAILPVGKVKVATLPLKDAGEMLEAGRTAELIDAFWSAKTWKPDGIVMGEDLWDVVNAPDEASVPYPYSGLNEKLKGIRRGEIVTLCAGSGMGKSQLAREISHHLVQQGETIGILALEESVKRTALGLMSLHANLPLHDTLDESGKPKEYPQAMLKDAFDATLGSGKVRIYDHFGSTDVENLLAKIRYMAKGMDCSFIVLDHISIVVSGIGDGDERRLIDNLMTRLRTLTEELGCGMILITHLKRPSGDKGHEDGAVTSLSHLRGSAAIAQLSDTVIGLERDQQAEATANVAQLRVLKNRWLGNTGAAGTLLYSAETGRMTEISEQEKAILVAGTTAFEEDF